MQLMDFNARFYSPKLGRFIQPDSIIPGLTNSQAWNRYSYVNNNPVNYIDPSGHTPCIDGVCSLYEDLMEESPPPAVDFRKRSGESINSSKPSNTSPMQEDAGDMGNHDNSHLNPFCYETLLVDFRGFGAIGLGIDIDFQKKLEHI